MRDTEGPFLLFCGDNHYPLGGTEDYKGTFATLTEAMAPRAEELPVGWFTEGRRVTEGSAHKSFHEGWQSGSLCRTVRHPPSLRARTDGCDWAEVAIVTPDGTLTRVAEGSYVLHSAAFWGS